MAIEDTFGFNEAAYAEKIKTYTTERLRENERIKYRQQAAAIASVGGGAVLAPFTSGISLLGSAYGARRCSIAEQKFNLIQAELKSRGIEPFDPKLRDVLVPVGITVATMGVAHGIPIAAHASAHAGSAVAAHAVSHTGTQAVHDVVNNPGLFLHGVKEGIECRASETGDFLTHGATHAADLVAFHSANIVSNAPYFCPAEMVGFAIGESAACFAATDLSTFLSGRFASFIIKNAGCEPSQAFTFWPPNPGCPELTEFTPEDREFALDCAHCHSSIDTSLPYYHCCDCPMHRYNCCNICFGSPNGHCPASKNHVLHRILPEGKECNRCTKAWLSTETCKLSCSQCQKIISESSFYHCCDCSNDDYDICVGCYKEGFRCLDPLSHGSLTLLPEPRKSAYPGYDDLPSLIEAMKAGKVKEKNDFDLFD